MTAWYGSCVVNLRLRFDEAFQIVDMPQPGPQGGDPAAASVPAATLGRTGHQTGFVGSTRPLITQTGKDNLSFVMDRVPKTAQVECPGYRQAGKFSLEFDWRELPIDPRLVRSAGVEVYFGSVSPEDFDAGMTRVEPDGSRRSIIRTTNPDGTTRDDLMPLAGVADTWMVSHTGESSLVKLEGRDLRGIFIDSPVNVDVAAQIDLSQSLDFVILNLLKGHPAAAYINIVYSPEDWPGGEGLTGIRVENQTTARFRNRLPGAPPSVLDRDGLTRVRRRAQGDATSSSSQDDKVTVWDLVTRYCFLVGAVPYFRGRNLVIRPARSIFDQSKPRFSPLDVVFDPATRNDDEGNPFTTRKMVFGQNIKELSFERKLAGVKVPIIEVVSFDTSSKQKGEGKLLISQYPPADRLAAQMTDVYPSGESSQTDKLVIPISGIRDQSRLDEIARSLWEEVGRGEMGGSCKTSQLGSFKGTNADPDLLRIRPGDVVEFLVDTRQVTSLVPGASTYIDSFRLSFDDQVAQVRDALSGKAGHGDENLARVIVASARSSVVDLLRSFRVANVVFTWGQSSGISVAFDFQNYFVVRYGVTEQTGPNTRNPVNQQVNSSVVHRPKVKVVSRAVVKSTPKGPNTTVRSIPSKGIGKGK